MSGLIERLPIRATIAGRWQAPLFVAGLSVLGIGIGRIVAGHHTVSFDEAMERVQRLQEADALTRAAAYLVELLDRREWTDVQRGTFHARFAGVIYDAERRVDSHNSQNLAAIVSNYERALRLGLALRSDDYAALGDAHRWQGRSASAVQAYRCALAGGVSGADRLRRLIIELRPHGADNASTEVIAELDAILNDSRSFPANYLWALERRLNGLLDRGDIAAGMALVSAARTRLAGTAFAGAAVGLAEAACLRAAGMREEAAEVLRRFQEHAAIRDDLWARSTWLLGRLEQEEDRPQSALSLYEEILRSFASGPEHEQALLGRAECMAELGRHERSVELFEELVSQVRPRGAAGEAPVASAGRQGTAAAVDLERVRHSVEGVTQRLLSDGRLALGVRFLDVAIALSPPGYSEARIALLTRRASALEELARRSEPGDDMPGSIRRLFTKAAETHLTLSQLVLPDEAAAAQHLEDAAENFESAGRLDSVIETLTHLVKHYPTSILCAGALVRMGHAYQESGATADAVQTFTDVIENYPRTPQALQSIVPLAACLLSMDGEEEEQRGLDLLLDIVDDRGVDPLFSPRALEYREAMLRLIDYYVDADSVRVPDHWESAIHRLEQAIGLYPDDPAATRLHYLLADAFRSSAAGLSTAIEGMNSPIAAGRAGDEAARRLERALVEYERVITVLASRDASALGDLERTYLQSSYLYRGDCLFDLGRYDEAIVAYREAAWRYENLPTAIAAMFQMVHCHQRLGAAAEARAALARLGWLLKKTPAASFDVDRGESPKEYWERMVARLEQLGV